MAWTLRERLQQAEEQRRLAAGLPPADMPAVADPPARTRTNEARIDLTDPARVLSYTPSAAPSLTSADAAPTATPTRGSATNTPGLTVSLPRLSSSIGLPVWQGSGPEASPISAEASSRSDQAPDGALDLDSLRRPDGAGGAESKPMIASKSPVKDRCPSCHGKVRLDRFDLDQAVAYMTCTECGISYTAKSPKL